MESLKLQRNFLPPTLSINTWQDLQGYYTDLLERKLNNEKDLEKFIQDHSELSAVVSEEMAWRYIKMTCDTKNKEILERYQYFVSEIEPQISPLENKLQKKLIECPYLGLLDQKKYFIYLRNVKKMLELFREENIPLQTQITNEAQKYGAISAEQFIEYNGETLTLQKAATFLKSNNREIRKEVYIKVQDAKEKDETKLNELFSELIRLRNQVALNAGFSNYRDYKFQELGRFDYSKEDCFKFHAAIKEHIVPLKKKIEQLRKQKLKIEDYRPWDTEVDVDNKEPLKPFTGGNELLEKTIHCFEQIHPYFAQCLRTMKEMKFLDLESRIGKAPGGYNYPLYESGVPFIFMNAVGSLRDVITMVHEGGHAIHSFLTSTLELTEFKNTPSEVAELASMSMELISMEHWNSFFSTTDELKRAKSEHLEKILKTLTWIASIDQFQHWIYENPTHSVKERYSKWNEIQTEFGSGEINYEGLESNISRSWQGQLHLYEVPFYYIEYGFAQLGAIALWKNYRANQQKSLELYVSALKLGYTKSIGEIYQTAGIQFDFSEKNIKELALFVKEEWEILVDKKP